MAEAQNMMTQRCTWPDRQKLRKGHVRDL